MYVKTKNSKIACKSTFEICQIANKLMSNYLKNVHESRFSYSFLLAEIKREIKYDCLYENTNFEHNQNHKFDIVHLVIDEFIRVKAVNRARFLTLEEQKKFYRNSYTHQINFSGQ